MPPEVPATAPVPRGAAGTAGTAGNASGEAATPEWAVQALDKGDEVVGKVRSVTTDRLVRIARVVVFGVLAAIMGLGPAELANIFGFSPKVEPQNCVLVGVRDIFVK